MITKETIQSFMLFCNNPMPNETGTEIMSAVNADSWRGEKFFVDSSMILYTWVRS